MGNKVHLFVWFLFGMTINNDVDIQSISRNKIYSRGEIYDSLLYLAEVRSSSQMVELLKKHGVR